MGQDGGLPPRSATAALSVSVLDANDHRQAFPQSAVAEVELAAPDEPYVRLDFLGQEVTGIKRYYNSHLRKYPYSAWSQEEKSGDI